MAPRPALGAALVLRTADGVRLAARHVPAAPSDVAFVVAHGFTGSTRKPAVATVVRALGAHAGVVAVDLRGHGRSGGRSTLGDREVLDVDAAVAAARALGYARVITCGWSMGASAVLRHAALAAQPVAGHLVEQHPDAVVSVSATSRWFVRDTVPMRRVHWLAEKRLGRAVARTAFRTRIDPGGWPVIPASPVEAAARIAPTPLLLVHGDRDAYFPLEHPQALAAAAGPHAQLWVVEGFGHAEAAATPDLLERIATAALAMVGEPPLPRRVPA